MAFIPFARQSVGDAYPALAAERSLNLYARPFPDGGASAMMLFPTPGMTTFSDYGPGGVRKALELGDDLYLAAGSRMIRQSRDGTFTVLGAIAADPSVTMATNGRDVVVAAGGVLSVWRTDTSTFATPSVTPLASGAVGSVCAVAGYVLATEANGVRVAFSGLRDALTWGSDDFFSAESSPDAIVTSASTSGEAWIFGKRSTEVWGLTGTSAIFGRLPGGIISRGVFWPGSVLVEDFGVFWVGDDKIVYRADGFQPRRISTEAVEGAIGREGYDETADVGALTYTWRGHKFWCLRLPDAPAWCYDMATGMWAERASGAQAGAWIARCGASWGPDTAFGTADGRLCTAGGVTDGGLTLVREAITPTFAETREPRTLAQVLAHFRADREDIGRPARAMLQVRRGGRGAPYGGWSPEKWQDIGKLGIAPVVRWGPQGSARMWQIRVRVTDPVRIAFGGVTPEFA